MDDVTGQAWTELLKSAAVWADSVTKKLLHPSRLVARRRASQLLTLLQLRIRPDDGLNQTATRPERACSGIEL